MQLYRFSPINDEEQLKPVAVFDVLAYVVSK
jgi:hypothetical protein